MAPRPHVLSLPGLVLGLLLIGVCAHAEPTAEPKAKPESSSPTDEARRKAGEIITQPARDVGVSKPEIPPVLAEAVKDTYGLQGLKTCRQLSAAVTALNAELGPDYEPGGVPAKENRGAKIAEAGGKTVVNSLIPFRQLVREISGAAPAKRSLDAAVDAGLARRGFLRGVHRQRGCRTPF
jgi:hypothetical protein